MQGGVPATGTWHAPACRIGGSGHRRDMERFLMVAGGRSIRPALRDGLGLGPEADALHPVLIDVAEARTLPAAEGVIGDRHRDRDIDPNHSDIDPGREFPRGMTVSRKDGDSVAVRMLAWKTDCFFEAVGSDHLQHWPEDFLLVGTKMGLHMIEQGWADEEALLMALKTKTSAVDHQLAAFVGAQLDVVFDALLVGLVDDGTVMG